MNPGGVWRRLRFLFRRDAMDRELEEEIRLHVQLRAQAERRAGLGEAEARSAALRRFGNRTVLQERSRAMWGFIWLEQVVQDTRYAVRRLLQRPGFALAVVGVLALGVGATTAMFSAVDAAMLRPLPFVEPAALVTLRNVQVPFDPGQERRRPPSPEHFLDVIDIAAMPDVFARVAAWSAGGLNLSDAERPLRVNAGVVTTSFFATLGERSFRGRLFSAEEGRPGGPRVAILSYGLWARQFGGRDVIGKMAQLNGKSFEIVGIMPKGFGFPRESELWIPMTVPTTFATFEPFRGFLGETVLARLANGMTEEEASRRLRARWEQTLAATGSAPGAPKWLAETVDEIRQKGSLTPLQRDLVGDRRSALLVLFGATGLLLLIACANVTNLLLSDASARRREIAVRNVLGATRGRIIRQLLAESLALALSGAALGVALAPIALAVIRARMPAQLAGVAPADVDLRVLAFATLMALVTGVGFGLWPALGTTRDAPGVTIKSGGQSGATAGKAGRARRALVSAEMALTFMLLVGAGLMLRSFQRLMHLDSGMETARVGTLEFSFGSSDGGRTTRLAKLDGVISRLSSVAGIGAVGAVNDLPLRDGSGMSISIDVDGVPPPAEGEMRFARYLMASSGYFAALGIPILRGRGFTALDDSLAPRVAMVNTQMVKQYWGGADALGRTFRWGGQSERITVIGIVADVREAGLDRDPKPQMYFPLQQETPNNVAIVARGTLRSSVLLARLVEAVRAVDPAQAVYSVRMMDEVVGASVASRRTNTVLIAAFAALALVLAMLGVYAVVAYGVARRSRELGIRAALGATGRDLLSLIAREMLWVTMSGLGAGIAGAWAISRVLRSLLYGVGAHDPLTFAVVPVVLILAAAAATLLPARKALRANPVEAIRAD